MKLVRARVTSKGQVTLPKSLRNSLDIHEGDHLEFAIEEHGKVGLRMLSAPGSSAGALKHLAKEVPVTVEGMDAAIRRHMRKMASPK